MVAKVGEPVRPEIQQTVSTLSVDAGETYETVFRADNPGTWLIHCHELHQTENDGVEPGGLIQNIQVGEPALARGRATTPPPATTPRPMPSTMPGVRH